MRDLAKEAMKKMQERYKPRYVWSPEATRRIQEELNQGLEEAQRESRADQAASEAAAAKLFLTF